MSARENDGPGGTDEVGIDVVLGQRHVGAVLAVEDEREGLRVADPQDDQRRQAFRVGLHTAGIDAFALQLLDDEAAHVLVADAGDHGGLQAQARGTGGRVGRTAAQVLGETGHVLQAAADLISVQIDGRTAYGNDIEV